MTDPDALTPDPTTHAQEPAAAPAAAPSAPDDPLKLLWHVWRAATDRETPTLLQLIQGGRVRRVDVDAPAGYVAVVTEDDTHRAIGVRREFVAPLVAAFTNRSPAEVAAILARGPAKLEVRQPEPAAEE